MIFLWLALIALTFGLMGFLLHMHYFGKQKLMRQLGQESESLKKALTLGAQEIATARSLVRSLEKQVAQRNDEITC